MIDLKNTNIVLTGATGGIGNSILEKLITSGANVLATGTNEDKLKSIKEIVILRRDQEIKDYLKSTKNGMQHCTTAIGARYLKLM